jgi:hypothetical protein
MNIILEAAKDVKKGQAVKLLKNGKVAPFIKKNNRTSPIGVAVNKSYLDKKDNRKKILIYLTCE